MLKKLLVVMCLSLFSFSSHALALSFKEVASWPEPMRPQFKTVVGMNDNKVAIQAGSFMLIRAYAGDACPAGQYFLANLELRTVTAVEIGTCDEEELTFGVNKAKGTTTNKSIDVFSHGDLAARIPVY
ncbi:hypothetical protein HOV30_gp212 [Erwinia phage Derbicus]|uniref:Uncharacterized protein n=2 Tax=Derbicusvirus derbicus TaxID=2734104 RepID=A0A482IFY5_9CAUD|nr:hypothetical protein BIZ82_gp213 [Erwinia phage vB_EamM_EarlPhillipIV]YP_009821256.1 hypothetical protein HOV30_gp212 [Erwinia phage Derbicus]ANZ49062.1 hypothetical protein EARLPHILLIPIV_213 [Erwinia phage vB_EamM_EarlPhillipIV]QBP07638.1 hypothetical protein DERBICUS_212 [Erwinia phage Derbicus]QXO09933.1 hypothetical protein pEaSNUABM38_00211 [Erwinia phage pEa_SNUABM_38]